MIGIKSSLDAQELRNKLSAAARTGIKLPLLELFLREQDLPTLDRSIDALLSAHPGLKLSLHTPIRSTPSPEGNAVSFAQDDALDVYGRLLGIAADRKDIIAIVAHPGKKERARIVAGARELVRRYDNASLLYAENLPGPLYADVKDFISLVADMGLRNVCLDFAHFSATHDAAQMLDALKQLKGRFRVYAHISDNIHNSGNTIPRHIGEGNLAFGELLPLIDLGVVETFSAEERSGLEMVEDWKKVVAFSRER
jgi:sugar phosphate isomerase/epimerase